MQYPECRVETQQFSEIMPEVLSTDAHGVNLPGYTFAPHYAQVGRVINEMFEVKEDENQRVQLHLKAPINAKRIMQH